MQTGFSYDASSHFALCLYLFTGKERDAESGNDYFGARYYASTMGRFLSPDPSVLDYADPTNPQSLNLYSYAQNNPLINIDPSGLDCVYLNDAGNGIEEVDSDSDTKPTDCTKTQGYYVPGRLTGYGTDSSDPDNQITSLNYSPYSSNVTPTSPEPTRGSTLQIDLGYQPQILSPQQLQTLVHQNNLSGLSDQLVACLAQDESMGNDQAVPLAKGGQYDRSGFPTAKGLMRVNNVAARELVRGAASGDAAAVSANMFNPAMAIQAGSAYLGEMARQTSSPYKSLSAFKGGSINQKGIDKVAACAGLHP